jgi:excinuclease ABC subunit C
MMKSQDLNKYRLPASPGVYFFKKGISILYIGKATSLKDRVRSYFSRDLANTRGVFIVDMVSKADRISFIKTNSVLEALILEANLIKKHQPKYNTKEKDDKSYNYLLITKEDFPRVLIVRGRELLRRHQEPIQNTFGPFTDGASLKIALKIIRKIFPFRDRCEPNSGKPCFNRQIGLCPGVCDGTISKNDYRKIIRKIKLFFSGETDVLKKNLRKEMNVLAKENKFEKANDIKRQIFALEHIQDVALIKSDGTSYKNEKPFRIEAYDAAHLSGTNNVGVMVVMEDGELKKNDYRKFNIRESKGNDVSALKEILARRLKHTDWPSPDLIVVDGGIAQLNIAKNLLYQGLTLVWRVVAVTKDDKHKPKVIIGEESLIKKHKKEILLINNEAHRFAIAFHRQKRNVIL